MKIITALSNTLLQHSLKQKYPTLQFPLDDITYQEGVMDALKLRPNTQALLLSTNIEGDLDKHQFITAIREINQSVKILLITKAEDKEYANWLASKGVYDIFLDGKTTFDDIYEAITREQKVIVKKEVVIQKEYISNPEVIAVEKVVEKPVSFQKLILTIWDNPEFGCELAYMTAKLTSFKVLLVDLDLKAPKAHTFLNVNLYPEGITNEGVFCGSGLNIVIDTLVKGVFTPEILFSAAVKRRELKNLYILTGNNSLENCGYFKNESLLELIDKAYQNFDITILLVEKSIHESYTVYPLIKSDFNLVPIAAIPHIVTEFNRYITLLAKKQDIPMEKFKFVSWEHDRDGMTHAEMQETTGNSYYGSIGFSQRRKLYRKLKNPYARRMDDDVVNDYKNMLARFHIVPRRRMKEKLLDFLKGQALTLRYITKRALALVRKRRWKNAVHITK